MTIQRDISELFMPIHEGRTKDNRKYLFRTLPEDQAGVSVAYDMKTGKRLQIKIAISYTSIANAHVFNYAGKPWLSQYWVRQVNEKAYGGISPDVGYGGHDEDQGQMGGVSALMSLGLFSLRGTTAQQPIYDITSPVFDEMTITLDPKYYPGREFIIKTYNNSSENRYIQKAQLNGKVLNNCWFKHNDFANGGILELWPGSNPNTNWGVAKLPPSQSTGI